MPAIAIARCCPIATSCSSMMPVAPSAPSGRRRSPISHSNSSSGAISSSSAARAAWFFPRVSSGKFAVFRSAPKPAVRDEFNTRATGPLSAMRPAYMTAIVSAISASPPRSCVTKIMPMPSSPCSRRSSTGTWICMVASSAVVGSSANSRRGLHDNAIAIIARWRSPPDNSCG